jgi:hypothetical protein
MHSNQCISKFALCFFVCVLTHAPFDTWENYKRKRLHGLKGFVEGTSKLNQEALKWLQNRLRFFFNTKKVVIFEHQENIYNFFRFIQVLTKLEYVVVKVNLIIAEFFQTTITTDLHFNMHTFTISNLIFNTFNYAIH